MSSPPIDHETPVQGALIIHPEREGRGGARSAQARLEEAEGLALALDLEIRRGETLLLEGVGGGFTWGSVLLDF